MLRITDIRETLSDGGTVWTLKLEGTIQGDWVKELRRAWRAVRLAASGASIRVVLGSVERVDAAGMALLREMHRDGVGIVASDPFTAAIRAEVVEGVPESDE
jgi:ABC-type transporter Mla MlaB component